MGKLLRLLLVMLLAVITACPCVALADGASDFVVTDDPEDDDRLLYQARLIAGQMTAEEKICQLMIVAPEALSGETYTLTAENGLLDGLRTYPVGGVVLFGQNVSTREQVQKLTDDMQAAALAHRGIGLLIVGQEEGGQVSVLHEKLGDTPEASAGKLGKSGDASQVRNAAAATASYLLELGFNMNIAVSADVLSSESGTDIGDRSFSGDPVTVADMACAAEAAYREGGVIPAVMHFPGHGCVEGSTHTGQKKITKGLEMLRVCELVPFQRLIDGGAQVIIASNLIAGRVDSEMPVSMSYEMITRLLREEMGFDGVVMTDSLRERYITSQYRPAQAALNALQAGTDVLYLPEDVGAVVDGLVSALESGRLSEERLNESVVRVLRLKLSFGIVQ